MRLHLTLAILFFGFLALGWWQLHRALSGNGLSWAYTFEWPLFAGYAIYVWWRLLHDDRPIRHRVPRERAVEADAQAERDRVAYNAYLASVHDQSQKEQG